MKKSICLLLLLVLVSLTHLHACNCGYNGSFLTVAKRTSLVALVKVKKYLSFRDINNNKTPMSMEVEVIEIYSGTETRKTFTVWGDNGILCRPYLSQFKEGEYYAIAFYPGKYGRGHTDEKETDYSISICGTYWLTVDMEKKSVVGDVEGDKNILVEWSMNKLSNFFKKPDL